MAEQARSEGQTPQTQKLFPFTPREAVFRVTLTQPLVPLVEIAILKGHTSFRLRYEAAQDRGNFAQPPPLR